MRKWTIVFSIVVTFSSTILAQTENFDLSHYKMPEITYRTLTVVPGLNGSKFNSFDNENRNRFSGFFSIHYYYFKNSKLWQRSANMRLNGGSTNSRREFAPTFPMRYEKLANTYLGDGFNTQNRYYFREKLFLEIDMNGTLLNPSKSKEIIDRVIIDSISNTTTTEIMEYQSRVETPFSIGIGRIEQVQDYRHALFILQDLTREGRINAQIDEETAMKVAEIISMVKKRRFFDQRIKQKYSVEMIDSILTTLALVTEKDARYFTTLFDNWLYASENIRTSGYRLSVGVAPGIAFLRKDILTYENNIQFDTSYKNNNYFVEPFIEFVYGKPINQAWQLDIRNRLSQRVVNIINSTSTHLAGFKGSSFMTFGYRPTSRTNIDASAWIEFNRLFLVQENKYINPFNYGIQLSSYYYFSPRMRLTSKIIMRNHNYLSNDNHALLLEVDLGLEYSLF